MMSSTNRRGFALPAAIGALVIVGVLSSLIGGYYYLRIIVQLFMKSPEAGAPIAVPMRSGYVVAVLLVTGYLVLQFGVAPSRYIDLALAAAKSAV